MDLLKTTPDYDEPEHYDWDEHHEGEHDEWVMDCGDRNCCMNFAPHFRSECYTPEMYEAMSEEAEREHFEAWVKATHPTRWPNPGTDGKRIDAQGQYRNAVLRMMWSAWLAAKSFG